MPSQDRLLLLTTSVLLLACLTLGGGTHAGYFGDVIEQALAGLLIVMLAWRLSVTPVDAPSGAGAMGASWSRSGALLFTAAMLAVPLLQLVPLGSTLTFWPGGMANFHDSFELIGRSPASRPLSAAPEATWLAFLSLLPAAALFWATAHLDHASRRVLCLAIVFVAMASVILAILQLANGPNSEFRFYDFTNREEAVGFFANRNHFAAFLYCSVVFAGAIAVALVADSRNASGRFDRSAVVLVVALAFCVLASMTAMQAMARSRAGVLLHGAALAGLIAMAPPALRNAQGRSRVRILMVVAAILSAAVLGELLLYRFVDRFAYESLQADARFKFASNTIEAARAFMPFGAGLGTFVRVYGAFEKPADVLANRFANHAHNDWLELWLETGVAGLLLAGIFLIWVGVCAVGEWRRPSSDVPVIDTLLARAGLLAIVLLLCHSVVDYPLRTEAMMALFAVAAGLQMVPAPVPAGMPGAVGTGPGAWWRRRTRAQHRAHVEPAEAVPQTPADAPRPVQARLDQRWTAGTAWPDAWAPVKPAASAIAPIVPAPDAGGAGAASPAPGAAAQPARPKTGWPDPKKP